jgi:hypothetical protein
LRCLEADVALLGAPDTFLDAIRRMIESFESFEQAYTASAIGCQAVVDALQEKPFNPDRAAAALKMNLPELARVRALVAGDGETDRFAGHPSVLDYPS